MRAMSWLRRVQPWCRFCGWRWRMWWIEYDYQCLKHWSPDALLAQGLLDMAQGRRRRWVRREDGGWGPADASTPEQGAP